MLFCWPIFSMLSSAILTELNSQSRELRFPFCLCRVCSAASFGVSYSFSHMILCAFITGGLQMFCCNSWCEIIISSQYNVLMTLSTTICCTSMFIIFFSQNCSHRFFTKLALPHDGLRAPLTFLYGGDALSRAFSWRHRQTLFPLAHIMPLFERCGSVQVQHLRWPAQQFHQPKTTPFFV